MSNKQDKGKEVKRTVRLVRCPLSDGDFSILGRRLAEQIAEVTGIESAKARATSEFGAQIKSRQIDIDELTETIRRGYKMRDVQCAEMLDTPEPGKKTINRTDTGETIAVEDMTAAEMQRELDGVIA